MMILMMKSEVLKGVDEGITSLYKKIPLQRRTPTFTPPTTSTRPMTVTNKRPENQHVFTRNRTVPGNRTFCIEIFKTINNLNPTFMRNIFTPRDSNRPVRNSTINNLEIKSRNTTTYGSKSLSILGPQIWNNLPYPYYPSRE